MYFRTTRPVLTQALVDAMLAALKTVPAGALMLTPKLELFTNVITPTPTTAWADYTKATFVGYAAATTTISTPVNLQNGDQAVVGNGTFTAGAIVAPESVTGYILSDGAANVYAAELFPAPFAFVNNGDFLNIDWVFPVLVRPPFTV